VSAPYKLRYNPMDVNRYKDQQMSPLVDGHLVRIFSASGIRNDLMTTEFKYATRNVSRSLTSAPKSVISWPNWPLSYNKHQPLISGCWELFQIFHYFRKIFILCDKFPQFHLFPKSFSIFIHQNFVKLHTLCLFRFPLILTMMHLCITQCTYWTPVTTVYADSQ